MPLASEWVRLNTTPRIPGRPLVVDIAHPNRPTILHGLAGSGKGLVSSWLATRAVDDGYDVCIADYEDNISEWRERIEAMGPTSPHIFYRSFNPSHPLSSIIKTASLSRRPFVILDSLTMAVETRNNRGNLAGTASQAMHELVTLGCPVIALAHVPKGTESDLHSTNPFGSMAYSAAARQVWSLIAIPEANFGRRVELLSVKNSDRAQPPTLRLGFTWTVRGTIVVDVEYLDVTEKWDAIRRVLFQIGQGSYIDVFMGIKSLGLSVLNLSEANVRSWLRRDVALSRSHVRVVKAGAKGRGNLTQYEWVGG